MTIFINFGANDTGGVAGRLGDVLTTEFRQGSVYFFHDDKRYGTDFYVKLHGAISRARIVLALVGSKWAPTVAVINELRIAKDLGKPILPVRIDVRTMPDSGTIPEDLRWFCTLEAPLLTLERWDADVNDLIEVIYARLGLNRPRRPTAFEPVLREARFRGHRARVDVHTQLARESNESILLQNVWARTTVRPPTGWNTVYRSLVYVVLTSRAMHLRHFGLDDAEVNEFMAGRRQSEEWILPYSDIRRVTTVPKSSTPPELHITYGASTSRRDSLDLMSINPPEASQLIVKHIEALAPAVGRTGTFPWR